MDEKQKQEMKEKAKAVAIETAQKAKEAGKAAAAKADELYNKLPLDKINEKLGGKVDVKSKNFKIGLIACIGILVFAGGLLLFSGSDTIPTDDLKFIECLLRDKKLFMEFGSVGVVNKKIGLSINMKRGKETFQEYIARCKKQYNEKDLKLYEEEVKSGMKNIDAEYAALKKSYELMKTRKKRIKILAQKACEILNKNFDEGFDTCKKVEVGRCYRVGPDYGDGKTTVEHYEGRAFIYNSRTGKTRERNLDMFINLDQGLYFAKIID